MKNLIPLMALLVVGGSFVAPAVNAADSAKCEDGSACCKDGVKKGHKKIKGTTDKTSKADSDAKPVADAK